MADELGSEGHALVGAIDRPALLQIRRVIESEEPLANPELDDFLNPSTLVVSLDDGLRDADTARIDVRWTTRGDYNFHYTDSSEIDFRWDNHPHGSDYPTVSGTEHFHPPPDASSEPDDIEDSCIGQSKAVLVTRAVLKLWRVAYHADSITPLNAGQNPP